MPYNVIEKKKLEEIIEILNENKEKTLEKIASIVLSNYIEEETDETKLNDYDYLGNLFEDYVFNLRKYHKKESFDNNELNLIELYASYYVVKLYFDEHPKKDKFDRFKPLLNEVRRYFKLISQGKSIDKTCFKHSLYLIYQTKVILKYCKEDLYNKIKRSLNESLNNKSN